MNDLEISNAFILCDLFFKNISEKIMQQTEKEDLAQCTLK